MVNGQWSMAMILISCLLMSFSAFSQKVSTLVSKEKIVLGEQLFVKIKLEGITQGQVQEDFRFPDTVNHLEILADSVEQLNSSTFEHTLTVTSFDSGTWQLPAFSMMLTDKRVLSSNPVTISVLPVDVSNMEDYHDIKDILEVNPKNNWWIICSIILIAIISLFGILWFMNNRKAEVEQKPIEASTLQELFSKTLQQLSELEAYDLSSKQNIIHVFSSSSDMVRSFIDKARGDNTAHLTTGEYMTKQKSRLPNGEIENSFFQFLRLSDAVKFAKYSPPAEETKTIFPMLKSLVTSVYQQTKPNT
jgi:hypothetical protein